MLFQEPRPAVIEQTLSQVPRTTKSPDLLSAIGTTHLVGAMISGRSRNRAGTQRHLLDAQVAAVALGRDGNHLWTAFGPTNVAIHRVAVAAQLSDYQLAADLGRTIDASPLPMERQVRYRLEVARALHFRRQQEEALGLVLDAERQAPEQVRRQFLTHSLVHE